MKKALLSAIALTLLVACAASPAYNEALLDKTIVLSEWKKVTELVDAPKRWQPPSLIFYAPHSPLAINYLGLTTITPEVGLKGKVKIIERIYVMVNYNQPELLRYTLRHEMLHVLVYKKCVVSEDWCEITNFMQDSGEAWIISQEPIPEGVVIDSIN